ncbi:MAG: hypothetical protein HDQ96_16170 [Lachnospiraceae bacterium]|nr:hypothetical protein [Lachnospiraceae bacterium]
MTNQLSESKLWKAITAVASSIITNLLCSSLSHNSYIIQPNETQYIVISDNSNIKSNTLLFVGILLLFFALWGILSAAIPISTKLFKNIRFKKMKFHSRKDLVNTISLTKEQALNLKDIFYDEQYLTSNINFAKLKIRELSVIISTLHATFIPHNQQRKLHMKDNFRYPEHSSIININSSVSKYEFGALIELLQKMVNNVSLYANSDSLMEQDCLQMSAMLKDLNDLVSTIE